MLAAHALPIAHMTEKSNSACISIFSFTHNSTLYRRIKTGIADFNLLAEEVDALPSAWFYCQSAKTMSFSDPTSVS